MQNRSKSWVCGGFFAVLIISLLLQFGCGGRVSRSGIMSEELPLTVADLEEMRQGEQNHDKVLEYYKIYNNPPLTAYVNAVASSIGEVSDRPYLPYQVFILDDEDVNMFGGPGGFIYISKGMLNYLESEAELAGPLAHEIAHLGRYDYIPRAKTTKVKSVYQLLMRGSDMAHGHFGSMGVAAHSGLKGIGTVAPKIAKRFDKDAEVEADKILVGYMIDAGYDPRAYLGLLERMAHEPIHEIVRFVNLMNTHPPFPERRELLRKQLENIKFDSIEFKQDKLTEIRQMMVNMPDKVTVVNNANILFEPVPGVRHADPVEVDQMDREKEQKLTPIKKRWSLF